MIIEYITVNNFKSLVNFDLRLSHFTCLIGLNGSGKSTVLQFIDFLSQLFHGDIKGWLESRNWKPADIPFHGSNELVNFSVTLGQKFGHWRGDYDVNKGYCTYEELTLPQVYLRVNNGELEIQGKSAADGEWHEVHKEKVVFRYQGSILSQLRYDALPSLELANSNAIHECHEFMSNIHSLELLSPEFLRQKTREVTNSIGQGGEKLSAFLHELGVEGRKELTKRLQPAYSHLESVNTTALPSGWKQLEIQESFDGHKVITEARHINDGMLRLLAIFAEIQAKKHSFLLFDEIENGINPELVEFVVNALVTAPQQILVTTHSPMILNYLDDKVAKNGVMYLYKDSHGHTKSIPFFSIDSLEKKLKVMGPGEAFVDTDLSSLIKEIESNPPAKSSKEA